jgi:type I restriction enzyme S subunit
MMPLVLIEKFDALAETPSAVPRLRRLVLELAVQGRLVPQEDFDGSGDDLLDQIRTVRTRGSANGRRSASAFVPSKPPTTRFPIPPRWSVACLGEVTECLDYLREPVNETERNARIAGKPPERLVPYFGATQQQGWIDAHLFDEELLLLGEDGVPFLDPLRPKAYIVNGKTWVNNHAHVFRGIAISHQFLMYCLNTHDYTGLVPGSTRTKLTQATALNIPVPIPPLAEQKRIVAKVDELMALCDRLEAQQKERDDKHVALARASMARFVDAPTPTNLSFLFHPSFAIPPSDLRTSILTLAVQGKLVPQHPADEPAEMIVERISSLREQFSPGKRAKAAKRIRAIDDAKCSHDVPDLWTWCRLGDLVLEFRYGTSRKCDRNANGVPVLRIPNIQSGRIDSTDLKFTDMPPAEFRELCLQDGDILLVRSNGSEKLVGRSAVASPDDERFAYAGYLVRARLPKKEIFAPFLHIALSTSSVRDQIEGPIRTTSGVKNINTTELSNLVLPLPPFTEQLRIVAKVDQLMALVDELETQLAHSRDAAEKLMESVVAELTQQV